MFSLTPDTVDTDLPTAPDPLVCAQQGDTEAFCELCRIHGDRLVRQATLLCGDPTLAEDLAQDTFVAAWKSLHRYHGRCQFFTWLCAILLNIHRNVRRKKRPLILSSLGWDEQTGVTQQLENAADDAFPPDQATILTERAVFLRECLQRLSPKHREVIHLRFYVDHSLEGIAAALDCSVGTVKSRLFHAVEQLRKMNGMDADRIHIPNP